MTDAAICAHARTPAGAAAAGRRPGGRRISRHDRLVATVLTLVLAVAGIAGGGVLGGGGGAPAKAGSATSASEGSAEATPVVVGPGETAWEALKPHRPADMDHAVFVHEVMSFNDVDARALRPGDVLRVPATPVS